MQDQSQVAQRGAGRTSRLATGQCEMGNEATWEKHVATDRKELPCFFLCEMEIAQKLENKEAESLV